MIKVRPKNTIYDKEGGWLSANWHFSFDAYYDPECMGFGTLRVFSHRRIHSALGYITPIEYALQRLPSKARVSHVS